ncbi:malonate decarboxylase subunit epsilon [Klebsiella pneumoniae]|nr:malonate decarboxylase subunit epsilon [Klebsiella pneumoniae]
MKILFTFPGQGGQRPGMLAMIPDREAILTQARAVLGDEVATLDSADALQHTRAVQLCLLIAGVAWARELQRQGVDPQMVSGLSIGAFPAAVIALSALDFASALRLVALRGDLMEQAYPEGYGLTAIMGLTRPRIEALLQGHEVYLANLNAETQFVIAGRDEAMAEVAQLALRAGASIAQRLAVSVPSHCALLDKPAAELAKAFAASLRRPRCAYLSGSTARVLWDPQRIADDLAMNMARPVHWQEAMVAADERDARLAIEMPPGGVLTCLTRQAGWRGETIALERSGLDVARHLAQRLSD